METTSQAQQPPSLTTRKVGRSRKNERKKKTEEEKILSPSHIAMGGGSSSGNNNNHSQGLDLGYMSGGSQCTPGLVAIGTTGNPPVGHTPLSGYHSSGCDTEYPSLPEDHGMPSLGPVANCITEQLLDTQRNLPIKTEQFSPPSQGKDFPCGIQPPPPPYQPPYAHNRKYRPSNLHTLPEIIGPTQGMNDFSRAGGGSSSHHSSSMFGRGSRNVLLQETFSSGYSSFDGSPNRASDEASLISGHHQSFHGSDLSSSSRSSYSTLSSRLSSPSSSYRRDSFENTQQSGRSIKPPDLVLKSLNYQMSDYKNGPSISYFSRQQSDDVSIRSSHSSRYSGSVSEYSDEFHRHPPLPDIHSSEFSPRQPLPPIASQVGFHGSNQSQSMPMAFEPSQYLPPASSITNLQSPESYADSMSGGSIPLQHLEMISPHHQQKGAGSFPMVVNTQIRSESPNLVVGNMSSFSNQLQQENLLFESLASTSSLGHSNLVQLPH